MSSSNDMNEYDNCPSYNSFDTKSFSNSTIPIVNNSDSNNSFCPTPNVSPLNGQQQQLKPSEVLEPSPTIEIITQALYTLYKSNDTNQRKLAEQWLILFQKQSVAWEFCPKLLLETNIFELQYFGASTIESKLKNEWNESSVEMKSKILNTIVSIIQNSTKLPVCCVTRVSVTLAIAVMYTFPDIWKNAMFDIINLSIANNQDIDSLSLHDVSNNQFNTNRLLMVLEFLSVLPEELKKQDLLLCKYSEIQKELKLIVDKIYKFLLSVLFLPINEHFDFVKIGFKALSGWLKYMLPSNGTILNSCFEISFKVGQQKLVKDSNGNANSIEYPLIESLALVLEGSSLSIEGQSNSSCYIDSFRYAIDQSCKIFPNFFNQAAVINQDDSKTKPIFNVFVQFLSSNNLQLFTNELIHKCLNLLITFSEVGSRETISLLFYLIDDFKTHTMLVQQDQNILKFFFLKLLNRFIDISMYPNERDDHCTIGGGDNCNTATTGSVEGTFCEITETLLDDDIEQFRISASDCFMNIQENDIIPKSTFLQFLIEKLNSCINEKVTNWEVYESILYYIYAFSGGSQDNQLEYVPILLNIIPMIPIKSIPLIRTTIKLVGRYASFLKVHTDYLGKVVFDLLPALSHKELIGSASSSLLSICISDKCSTKLWPYFNQILDQIEPTILGPQKSNPATIDIYKSLLHILQKAPINELSQPFTRLISPIIPKLSDHIPKTVSLEAHEQLIIQLSILYSVNEIIEYDEWFIVNDNGSNQQQQQQPPSPSKHPLYPFFQTTIPIQGQLLKRYQSDFEIIDLITMFYRYMMLYFREIANDFIDEILQQATQSFNQYPISSLLQIISAIIIPKLPSLTITNIKNSITLISNKFICNLKSMIKNDVNNQFQLDFTITPDITKDYLILLTKILKTLPQCIEPNIISTICIYIVYNLNDLIKDKPTTNNCCLFLSNCLSLSNGKFQTNDPNGNISLESIKSEMNALFESDPKHSYVLVYNILMNICWNPSSSIQVIQHFSDVLLSFSIGYPQLLKYNATNILNDPNFLKDKQINPHDKQSFLSNILKSNSTQTDYRSSVRTFSFICNDKE